MKPGFVAYLKRKVQARGIWAFGGLVHGLAFVVVFSTVTKLIPDNFYERGYVAWDRKSPPQA